MKELSTDIEIDAPAARVWQVLTDTEAFSEWNPSIASIDGQLEEGSRISMRVTPKRGMAMTVKATVIKAEPDRELRWLGHLVTSALFAGEQSFTIEPLSGGSVRFHQAERFTGILVPLMGLIGAFRNTHDDFVRMNEALKNRAEADSPE